MEYCNQGRFKQPWVFPKIVIVPQEWNMWR